MTKILGKSDYRPLLELALKSGCRRCQFMQKTEDRFLLLWFWALAREMKRKQFSSTTFTWFGQTFSQLIRDTPDSCGSSLDYRESLQREVAQCGLFMHRCCSQWLRMQLENMAWISTDLADHRSFGAWWARHVHQHPRFATSGATAEKTAMSTASFRCMMTGPSSPARSKGLSR